LIVTHWKQQHTNIDTLVYGYIISLHGFSTAFLYKDGEKAKIRLKIMSGEIG
jgi:hypothetical protein